MSGNIITLGFLGIALPLCAQAQTTVNIDAFEKCSDCTIDAVPEVRLGTSAPDLIETEHAWAIYHPERRQYLVVAGPVTLGLFDDEGRLLHTFGRRGAGPGEFGFIQYIGWVGEHIGVLDGDLGRLTVVEYPTGELVRSSHLPMSGVRAFHALSGDSVLLAAASMAPAHVGIPLHLVRLSSGDVLSHFGSSSGSFNAATPWSHNVLLQAGKNNETVWIARPNRLRLEEWAMDGSLLRTLDGSPDWFPVVRRLPRPGDEPPTRLREFLIDGADRLWLASWEAADDWRSGITAEGGETFIDTEKYFRSRIDAYDLRRGIYLGTIRVASDKVRLLDRAGVAMVQFVEYTSDFTPVLSIARLEVTGSLPTERRSR